MDLTLVTGTIGASKTLNTIKHIDLLSKREARPVFYFGIEEVKFDWQQMPDPDVDEQGVTIYPYTWEKQLAKDPSLITPHSWYNAPPLSIVLIDEAHFVYPAISTTKQQPYYITLMSKVRHYGISLYLITQGPSQINANIKNWIQPHVHYDRLWGGLRVAKYVNETCIDNPRNKSAVAKNAIRSLIKIDKSYYGTYKSAAAHTENKRVNKKLLLLLFLPLFTIPLFSYLAISSFKNQASEIEQENTDEEVAVKAHSSESFVIDDFSYERISQQESAFNPMTAYIPRIEALPETAPAYDELRKPQDFPRPHCIASADKQRCNCYTQQSSLMRDYPRELCISFVEDGYFDATKSRTNNPNNKNEL